MDAQYDRIDEVEETMAELKSQIYELKKNQIDADSIYGFLGAFNEVYSECTDAEKKQFMQVFIERIDIFPERREDGNWFQNIKFQFPVPIIKEGKEVAQIKEISLDEEKSDEHMISLEKLSTLETVCLLSKLHEAKHHVNVRLDMDEMAYMKALQKLEQMTNDEMISLAAQMVQIASKYNLVIESCAEQINLHNVGVQHGSCIDKKLIEKILGCKLIGEKDKNQREECGCFESVEVGAYNTCLNGCKYCYANFNDEKVKENVRLYNQASPLLCGNITSDDKITDRKVKSLKDAQLSFFE